MFLCRCFRDTGKGPRDIMSPEAVAAEAEWYRYRIVACLVTNSNPVPLKTRRVGQRCTLNLSRAETSSRWCGTKGCRNHPSKLRTTKCIDNGLCRLLDEAAKHRVQTATAGSDVVQSGRPIFDDFFQHLWPYIGNNTANVVFQMVERLWLIRIDQ
ncbi:histone-lysine N-methyltransferase SETMAR [Trichonephila clavipes]|nr:histone-lysine N-methyltransferase SETMAR [Trichonephila clavipes]